MKRSPMPRRSAPLRRSAGMRATARSGRIRRQPLSEEDLDRRKRMRHDVFDRDRRCLMSHLPSHQCFGGWTVHHVHKASAGGEWSEENLVTLCAGGNVFVEDHPLVAKTLGLVVNHEIDQGEAAERRRRNGLVPLPSGTRPE